MFKLLFFVHCLRNTINNNGVLVINILPFPPPPPPPPRDNLAWDIQMNITKWKNN